MGKKKKKRETGHRFLLVFSTWKTEESLFCTVLSLQNLSYS